MKDLHICMQEFIFKDVKIYGYCIMYHSKPLFLICKSECRKLQNIVKQLSAYQCQPKLSSRSPSAMSASSMLLKMSGSMLFVIVLLQVSTFDAVFHVTECFAPIKHVVPRSLFKNLSQQTFVKIPFSNVISLRTKQNYVLLFPLPCKTRGNGHSTASEPFRNGWESNREDFCMCPC